RARRGSEAHVRETDRLSTRPARVRYRPQGAARVRWRRLAIEHAVADGRGREGKGQDRADRLRASMMRSRTGWLDIRQWTLGAGHCIAKTFFSASQIGLLPHGIDRRISAERSATGPSATRGKTLNQLTSESSQLDALVAKLRQLASVPTFTTALQLTRATAASNASLHCKQCPSLS